MLDECDANRAKANACDRLRLGMNDMRLTTAISPQYLRERRELIKRASVVFSDANLPEKTLRTALR